MSYQIETAQRDAEIQRLRNEKLQIELDEHKRMHVILENLATRDPLTNLYNRRHFLVAIGKHDNIRIGKRRQFMRNIHHRAGIRMR